MIVCDSLQLEVKEVRDETDCSVATAKAAEPTIKSLANKRSIHKSEATLTAHQGDRLQFTLELKLEEGLHFTEGAPSQAQLVLYGSISFIKPYMYRLKTG